MSEVVQLPSDWDERAKANNFATPKEIVTALNADGTIILDVRTEEEIQQDSLQNLPENVSWKKTGCTRTECPALELDASKFVSDKNTTVVVYCKSGARANRAKMVLEKQGYTNVLNGGGLCDMVIYPKLKNL